MATAGSPAHPEDLWDHADIDEVRRECRAQVERAVSWGVEPTHLTTHLLAMQQRPEFFDVLLDIAVETGLPVRLESGDAETAAGFPFRRLATEEGVSMPDHFRLVRGGTRTHLEAVLADLAPGVTEVAFAPALAAEEIRAIDPAAAGRFDDLAVLTDRELHARLEGLGVTLIGYRALRDAQRAAALSQSSAASAPNTAARTSRRSISQALWSPSTLNDPSMNAASAVVVPSSTPVKAS